MGRAAQAGPAVERVVPARERRRVTVGAAAVTMQKDCQD